MREFPKRLDDIGAFGYGKTILSSQKYFSGYIIFLEQEFFGSFDIAIGKKALLV